VCICLRRLCLVGLIFLFGLNTQVFAQNDNMSFMNAANSLSPSKPTWSFPQGSVNIRTGTFHISIPLRTIPQRLGPLVALSLEYDSLFYTLADYTINTSPTMDRRWTFNAPALNPVASDGCQGRGLASKGVYQRRFPQRPGAEQLSGK